MSNLSTSANGIKTEKRDILWRCRKIGIIQPTTVLNTQVHLVSTLPAVLEIVLLEVKSSLDETVFVRDIMDHVGHVKSVCDGGVKVRRVRRV